MAVLACLATGCSSRAKETAREQSHLRRLALVYGRFLSQHRGQPPANEAEFKKFAQSIPAANLAAFGISDPNGIFVSNRDKKPYIVIYGKPKGPPGPGGSPVIAYEQEGKGGKRFVASAVGAVEEVDAVRFRELAPAAER
jgi:hypothetical protein